MKSNYNNKNTIKNLVSAEKAGRTLRAFPDCFYCIEFGDNGIHTLKAFEPTANIKFDVVKFIADQNYVVEYHETIVDAIVQSVMQYGADIFDQSVLVSPVDAPFNIETAVRMIGINYGMNQCLYICPENEVIASFDNSCAYDQFLFDYAEAKARKL